MSYYSIRNASNERSTQKHERVAWLDIARGAAILFVVFYHSVLAARVHGDVSDTVASFNAFVSDFRMPLFFFCSGILAFWGLAKPWHAIISNRIAVLAWIILIWTAIYFGWERVADLYPWHSHNHQITHLLWDPIGGLWFIYAILICTLLMWFAAGRTYPMQLLIVVSFNAILAAMVRYGPDVIADSTVNHLANYVVLNFALGYWLAPAMVVVFSRLEYFAPYFLLSFLAFWVSRSVNLGPLEEFRAIRSIPDIMFALSFAGLLSWWPKGTSILAWVGRRTLEIFLLHQVFIGLCSALAARFQIESGNLILWATLVVAILGSIFVQQVIRYTPARILIRPPNFNLGRSGRFARS